MRAVLVGPLLLFAALLAAAGLAKLVRPVPTRSALHSMALPSSTAVVLGLGVVEVAIAVSVPVIGGRTTAALVGAAYFGFTVFVAIGLTSGRLASCGCFGQSSAPPGPLHLAVTAGGAGVGFAAAVWPVAAVDAVVAEQPLLGLPFLALVGVGAFLLYALMTVLPAALATRPSPTAAPAFRLADPRTRS